jgi:hypothetical protein
MSTKSSPRSRRWWTSTLLGLLLGNLTTAFAEDDEPAATPYRPSVSSPATLSAPGWLDVEFGWQRAKGGGDKARESYPVTAKLAFNKDWGVVIGSELGVRRTDFDNRVYTGVGDTTFLVKHRIPTANEDTAWGVAAGFKSPTAKDTIGSGKADAMVSGIFSTDFSASQHLDVNLTATRLGRLAEGDGRIQYGWAAALSHSLGEKWTVFGEPSGSYQSGAPSTSQLMFGTSYGYSKRLVFDFAVATGMSSNASDWQAMAGLTALLGRLW